MVSDWKFVIKELPVSSRRTPLIISDRIAFVCPTEEQGSIVSKQAPSEPSGIYLPTILTLCGLAIL